jgi:RNA polymerase sigma-70 factor (ECF subfamily)
MFSAMHSPGQCHKEHESETSPSLLERLRKPDEPRAWSRFVELYTPLLFFWSRRLGLSPQDAEDLVQDVFADLIQKLPDFTYNEQKSFRGWLRKIVINKWNDRQRRRQLPRAGGEEANALLLSAAENSPFWEGEHRQFLVHRALEVMQADFEPTTWKAFLAFVVEGKTGFQVAAELGISEGAVYVAKCRVLRRLRQELSEFLA